MWLLESWVEFRKPSANTGEDLASYSQRSDLSISPPTAPSLANSSVERLLLEAQKESSGPSSYINSRASSQERWNCVMLKLLCLLVFCSCNLINSFPTSRYKYWVPSCVMIIYFNSICCGIMYVVLICAASWHNKP